MGESTKPLSRKQVAGRLSIGIADLPVHDGPWLRQQVTDLRRERPDWLVQARRAYAAQRAEEIEQDRLAHERWLADQPRAACLCCKTEFANTMDSGGLCDTCNEGGCSDCGQGDET